MHLYLDSNGEVFPADNGSLFLVRLYVSGILSESGVFLCPSTGDDNGRGGAYTQNYKAGDIKNKCSYAGRNNINQNIYPGIFTIKNAGLTVMGSDDWQGKGRKYNHPDGCNFVSVDGHSERVYDEEKIRYLIDPLGN